jgi:muramoyltetrapeptide carboxypeptidase LdcA involved in peptidoglycan recycling
LKEGDTIAIVSQSFGGPQRFPHIYDNGVKNLVETFKFNVEEYPTTRADNRYLHEHPEKRAEDINDAFADPEVKGIFSSIGGEDSIRILPYIDVKKARSNPKIILGYSDAHTLVTYLNSAGLVTYAGPCVMAGFSQMKEFPQAFSQHLRDILLNITDRYQYQPYEFYSERYPDWSLVENTGRTNPKKRNNGWKWLQLGKTPAVGKLFGGCMDVLEFIKGTRYWPQDPTFWDQKILFLETSEQKPSPDLVRYWLRNYGMQGILDRINGVLFGRSVFYNEKEKQKLEESIMDVVKGEFKRADIPIITDMDFGHTDPQFIMPLGVEAEIDSESKRFMLTEPAAA